MKESIERLVELSAHTAEITARWMRTPAFDQLARDGRVTDRVMTDGSHLYCCEAFGTKRAFSAEDRTVEVVASDGLKNRYGDIDDPDTWIYDSFDRNPIVLLDHFYAVASIVGTVTRHWRDGSLSLEQHLIDPSESGDASAMVLNKLAAGSLRAVSRSFIPWRVERVDDKEGETRAYYVLHDLEQLETSWVAIPAVRNALRINAAPSSPIGSTRAIYDGAPDMLRRIDEQLIMQGILARFEGGDK